MLLHDGISSQLLYDSRQMFQQIIDVRFGVIEAETKTNAAASVSGAATHGQEHVRRIKGAGSASRTAGGADSKLVQQQQNALGLDVFKGDIARVGKAGLRAAIAPCCGNAF